MSQIRVGVGYDVHELVADRPLIIGGGHIPNSKGLKGHSDADVLAHAISDALLGALSLGSIGDWFPDTDPAFKDSDSIELLKIVYSKIRDKGYELVNLDSVLVAQAPKFKPYIADIKQSIAAALKCNDEQVGVKATTTERLGFEGREEGIAAQATVLIQKND